jgi:tagatose 1,6-diphosphate aldolase GatY/KbaY
MLTPFAKLLEGRHGTAVGAFTCYDLEAAAATLRSASATRTGVILLISKQSYVARDGSMLLAALLAAAQQSDAHACVQLDHCSDLAVIESALEAGVGAVMADGSGLPYEHNVEFVRRAVALARRFEASVEAELGGIAGDEEVAEAASSGALTEPGQAGDFVVETGADCLAVSIGNVHGVYRNPPELDWERLRAIRLRVAAPLSLHGASGIPDELVRRAISGGITKINVNTELRQAYLASTREALPGLLDGSRLGALHAAQVAAVEQVVAAKLRAFDTREAS